MRTGVRTISQGASVFEFKEKYPLDSTQTVVVLGANERNIGVIIVPDIYSNLVKKDQGSQSIEKLIKHSDQFLIPQNEAQIAASKFEENECEALAVLNDPFDKKFLAW